MKILFFINDLRSGGKERRLVELIKGLSNNPSTTIDLVLTREIIHYEEVLSTNVKIYYVKRKEGVKKDPRVFYKFYKITKKIKPDVIHVWGNLTAVYALPTKLILNIPMINSQITDAPIKVSKSILGHNLTFPFSNRILSNSKAGLKAYNAPLIKSRIIYNGFDFNRINNLEDKYFVRNKFNIQTKYVIGMVASFSEKKDYKTYIEAAIAVLEYEKDATFICVGEGDYSNYEVMIPKKNKENIHFLGRQSNVESIMNICDIGVLISNTRVHGEGISNALMEFMALKKPVIANNNGGNAELIINKKNGFILKEGSIELKDKILFLLNNELLRNKFGMESQQIIKNNFSIDTMIDLFKREYEMVIK